MSKKEEKKESIEAQIRNVLKELENYNIETDIHNFKLKEDYRTRFENCDL